MSEDSKSESSKKNFFKLPADLAALSDDEIDDLALEIWSKFMNGQDQPKSE